MIPPWRRLGVGSRLCSTAVFHARRLGLPAIHLYTHENEPFYRRRGWRKLSEIIDFSDPAHGSASFMDYPAMAVAGMCC